MTYNGSSGESPAELHERAVAALVRVWGVTEAEARESIERVKTTERRLRRNGRVVDLDAFPRPDDRIDREIEAARRRVVDLRDNPDLGPEWSLYRDHDGHLVYGKAE